MNNFITCFIYGGIRVCRQWCEHEGLNKIVDLFFVGFFFFFFGKCQTTDTFLSKDQETYGLSI